MNTLLRGVTALLVLVICLPIVAQNALRDGELSVMTYNVQNFFDVFDSPYTGDEGTSVKARNQVTAIADAIEHADSDVVFFQEIENEAGLVAMVAEQLPESGFTHAVVTPTNSSRGINLGVLSRVPIISITSHRWQPFFHPDDPGPRGETFYFARDLQEVVLDLGDGQTLTVFNVHLKSNRDSEGDPNSMTWRTAEAKRVKDAVREKLTEDADAWVLAVGDFNSDYMETPGRDRKWPAMTYVFAPEQDGSRALIDVHADLPRSKRATLPGSNFYPPATFDFILASPAFAKRLVRGSAEVIHDEKLTTGSDHFPVVATFRVAE
ncbi:MAG: endonuclease/exonuclease/phosphatase family protein [Planctomycetota bacterium]